MPNHDATNRLTFRHLALAAAGFGIFALVGGMELPLASAHDLTGFAATPFCDGNGGQPTARVSWEFFSKNASGHHIVKATFNRPTTGTSVSDTNVMTVTTEQPGPINLTATATFEDGHVSSYNATSTMVEGVCPQQATTIATPTTVLPDTTVPTFAPPTTITPIPTSGPTVDSTPSISNPPNPVTPPATSVQPGPPRTALPVTGGSSVDAAILAGLFIVAGAVAIFATRRKNEA